jgi:hypothetical protein
MKSSPLTSKGFARKTLLTFVTILGTHSVSAAGTQTYTGEGWAQGQQPYYINGKCADFNCAKARALAYEAAKLQCYQDGARQCDYVDEAQTYFKDYGCGAALTICYMSVVFRKTK